MATTRPVLVDEENLTPEQRRAFEQLVADYKEAATTHVSAYTAGIARKIAVALILDGWRKQAN